MDAMGECAKQSSPSVPHCIVQATMTETSIRELRIKISVLGRKLNRAFDKLSTVLQPIVMRNRL